MGVREEARRMKAAAPRLGASSLEQRNDALARIAAGLRDAAPTIFEANRLDLAAA